MATSEAAFPNRFQIPSGGKLILQSIRKKVGTQSMADYDVIIIGAGHNGLIAVSGSVPTSRTARRATLLLSCGSARLAVCQDNETQIGVGTNKFWPLNCSCESAQSVPTIPT